MNLSALFVLNLCRFSCLLSICWISNKKNKPIKNVTNSVKKANCKNCDGHWTNTRLNILCCDFVFWEYYSPSVGFVLTRNAVVFWYIVLSRTAIFLKSRRFFISHWEYHVLHSALIHMNSKCFMCVFLFIYLFISLFKC